MIKQYSWYLLFILQVAGWAFLGLAALPVASAASLATIIVQPTRQAPSFSAEGAIEAIKSTLIAPQVSGNITALTVKAGDQVKAGQLLARIDTRMANQQALASQAQVAAAKAQLSAARNEFERKNKLYEKKYISLAALERAESDFKTAEAQTKAQLAQTTISGVETGLHSIHAPYAGVIAEVMTELGAMAMPGQPILSMYDPSEFRVTVNVPQSVVATLILPANIAVQIPAAATSTRNLISNHLVILPLTDPVSNMVQVRISLPQHLISLNPGMFARAILPINSIKANSQILVPLKSIIKRSELIAVYVMDKQGRAQLRQVRLGRQQGENMEIFAGLQAGELVALDPIAAANLNKALP